LHDIYIVLVAKTNEVYEKWLHYFEAIRFKNTGRSILKRHRTTYRYSEVSQVGKVHFQNNISESIKKKVIEEQEPKSSPLQKALEENTKQ
jgi:hypothetical protein